MEIVEVKKLIFSTSDSAMLNIASEQMQGKALFCFPLVHSLIIKRHKYHVLYSVNKMHIYNNAFQKKIRSAQQYPQVLLDKFPPNTKI